VSEPRVRRAKGAERIAEVLAAAEALLGRRGVEGMSLRAVADEVGISVGNLQYYFPTRAALLDAVFEHQAGMFNEEFAAIVIPTDEPRAQFESLVDYWLGVQHTLGQSLFWHLWAISPHDETARKIMDRIYRATATQMSGWLREIHPALSRGEAVRRAAAITTLIEGSGLFVGYGRKPRRELVTLQTEIRLDVFAIVDRAPTRPRK
jgi:AcrR family transcriptional regulator